jgi:hypothetical protein
MDTDGNAIQHHCAHSYIRGLTDATDAGDIGAGLNGDIVRDLGMMPDKHPAVNPDMPP